MNKDLQRTEQNAPTPGNQKTIGIDLGDRWSRYCILGGDGQIVEEDRIPTSTGALERAFKKMTAENRQVHVTAKRQPSRPLCR